MLFRYDKYCTLSTLNHFLEGAFFLLDCSEEYEFILIYSTAPLDLLFVFDNLTSWDAASIHFTISMKNADFRVLYIHCEVGYHIILFR